MSILAQMLSMPQIGKFLWSSAALKNRWLEDFWFSYFSLNPHLCAYFFTSSTAAVSWFFFVVFYTLCSTWENNVVGHYFLQVLAQQRAGSQMMKFWPIAKGGRARAANQKTESPRNSWWAGALPILDVMLQGVYIVKQTFLPALALSLYNCRVIYVSTTKLKIMNSQNT